MTAMPPHGWMWLQGAEIGVDRDEFAEWMERSRRLRAGESWFPGETFRRYPTKADLRASGVESVLDGWTPSEPIIGPTSRVVAFGSCFAAHFVEWLAAHGYNQAFTDSCRALMRNPFENAAVIAQQFRWAFGELGARNAVWIDKSKQRILATEERRLALREALLEADVFVTTLGLSELWYDKLTDEPLWRVMPVRDHDPQRHAFRVLSVADTIRAFETIDRIRAQWLPNLRIVYTLSPVPLSATFRPVSPITANSASKAILRAALDEFFRSKPDALNRTYFYFPGYEIVTAVLASPYSADNRHLYDHAIECVLDVFARCYTTHRTAAPTPGAGAREVSEVQSLHAVIAQLEGRNRELQQVCDERLVVIEQLKSAGERPAAPTWRALAGRLRATLQRRRRPETRPS